jgi:hypothetical protein
MSEWSAIATFFAGKKLSRMGIDMETSSISTVAERLTTSVRSTSKSSGESRTGVPAPARQIAFLTVCSTLRWNGSPNS